MSFQNNALVFFASIFTAVCFAQTPVDQQKKCVKLGSVAETEMINSSSACFQSPELKWILDQPQNLNLADMVRGQTFSPELSANELSSKTVFCQFFPHSFSSDGSAKFMCARTNEDGVFYNNDGELVPEAKYVSSKNLNIKIQINGIERSVDEGYLLDSNSNPVLVTKKNGTQKLVRADELKVKYFIDKNQMDESQVSRQQKTIQVNNRAVTFDQVFEAPTEITNSRWNEVFTEVAVSRLFWFLGLPTDTIYSMDRVVCTGCNSHPLHQDKVNLKNTTIFNRVSIKKKMSGVKLSEQFSFNDVYKNHKQTWSKKTQLEYEQLALGYNLISYFSSIGLQNRLQCLEGQMTSDSNVCLQPIGFAQDIGSSLAGKATGFDKLKYGSQNPRGAYSLYKKQTVFKNKSSCELQFPLGADSSEASSQLSDVSREALELFKIRLASLNLEVVEAAFESAHLGDMEPEFRDGQSGNSLLEKRKKVTQLWAQTFMAKVQEVLNMDSSRCRTN